MLAGVEYLAGRKQIDPHQISLVGHSEGGTIASFAAVRSRQVAFIVMMASPGLSGVGYNLQFEESMGRVMGPSEEEQQVATTELRRLYQEHYPEIPEQRIQSAIERFLSPWFRYNLTYDPGETLSRVNCPVLAIFGEKDAQVPPEGNARAIRQALAAEGNRDYTVEVLPTLNHYFLTAETGAPVVYRQIEETISPEVLQLLGDWILEQSGRGGDTY